MSQCHCNHAFIEPPYFLYKSFSVFNFSSYPVWIFSLNIYNLHMKVEWYHEEASLSTSFIKRGVTFVSLVQSSPSQKLHRSLMEKLVRSSCNKEYMRMAMLKHEETFKEQVLLLFLFLQNIVPQPWFLFLQKVDLKCGINFTNVIAHGLLLKISPVFSV